MSTNNYEVLEQICTSRRSIRKWLDKPVPEELIKKAIDLGSYAPNGGGYQPYHVYLIQDPKIIKSIADANQRKADLIATWPESENDKETIETWRQKASFFAGAPSLLAICITVFEAKPDKIYKQRPFDSEANESYEARKFVNSALQSTSAFIMQTLLALHTLGLSAVWATGPMQAKADIEKILNINDDKQLVALIPVGYKDQEPKERTHKPLTEYVTVLK